MKRDRIRLYMLAVMTAVIMILLTYGIHKITDERVADRTVKAGFVYVGDISTGYTGNFVKAQKEVEQKYGSQIETVTKFNVPEDFVGDALDELLTEGCQLIFTNSYGYGDTVKEYAGRYPDVEFCQAACNNANVSPVYENYHTFMGTIYQGRYISGVIAGMKLKELIGNGVITKEQAKVGYVGAYENPEVVSGYTAFIIGIRSIVPEAVMTVQYTNIWEDYYLEKVCAEQLIDEGCVVISQHSDTTGPAVACEETDSSRPVYYISYNDSMADIAPTTYLTGTKINWEPYIEQAVAAVLKKKNIEDCINGNIHGNDVSAGFEQDWIQMLALNEFTAAEGSRECIDTLVQKFKRKQLQVFCGEYTGTDINDPSDKIDLRKGYQEYEKSSAPSFHYILDDVITIRQGEYQ